jgi:hypothetical protein
MELYGKETSQFETVLEFFLTFIGKYEPKEVFDAMKIYVSNRTKFPTPADLIGIMEGRIKRDMIYYSRLLKKKGNLTNDESYYIQQYELQTQNDWE